MKKTIYGIDEIEFILSSLIDYIPNRYISRDDKKSQYFINGYCNAIKTALRLFNLKED